MIKIKVCDIDPGGACSYYRGIGPLSKLKYLDSDIRVEYLTGVDWYTIADADIVFYLRPWDDSYLAAIKKTKEFGVPIWVDLDDLVHNIPSWNPANEYFRTSNGILNLEKSIALADVVTVATPALATFYRQFNKNIHVVENAHNDYNYPWILKDKQEKLINWRGSATHRKDLQSVSSEMFSFANNHEDWNWCFIGNDIWFILEKIKKHVNIKALDIISYYNFITKINPAIQIVPLEFHDFNFSKSNIGWMEGTYSGATTLAPLLPEFERPGCVNYTQSLGDFEAKLEDMVAYPKKRLDAYHQSFHYIRKNLLLSIINKKRIDIIKSLI